MITRRRAYALLVVVVLLGVGLVLIFRQTGSAVHDNSFKRLDRVAAVLARDVWAVGYYQNGNSQNGGGPFQTLVERWNGTSWLLISSPNVGAVSNLEGAAAVSANDVWAVGSYSNGTLVEHWNGTSWSVVPSPNARADDNSLEGVTAVSANDVWDV